MNLRYSLHALALLAVAAGATLVAAPASADTGWHIVGNGETLTWPHAYTYYRFIVKARSAETDRLAFSELALYDADGTRLTAGLAEADSEARATTNLVAASFAYYGRLDIYSGRNSIFDGSTTTFIDGWIDRWDDSQTADDQKWKWEYIVIRLANGANPVASYNVAYSSENGKPIRGWALEGSDDHTTWFTLDERDIPAVAAIAPSGTGWCNGGAAIPVTKDSARFFVERGGTLAVTAPADAKSVHAYGGTVSIASQATLGIDVDAGESDRCVGGGLAGTGTFEKTGAGTLVVSGVNDAFAGTVKSSGGTLAFRPLHASPKYTYYRFIVKDRDAVYGGNDHFKLTEIALFDADGRHINGGLVEAAAEDKTTTNLLAGTFAVYRKQGSSWGNDSYKNVFDGKTSTGCHVWISRYNSEWHWAYFVFRPMAGNDVAPAFYNIGFAADCNVRSWALQGSDDHTTWITLDEMNAAAVAAIKPEGAG